MVSIEKVASLSERRRSCSSGFSPLVLLDVLSKNSFDYRKLPQVPINLTVRKLDGSFFVIEVANSATIEDLKQAVETCFSHFPKKGMGQISWPHVWGSFCLCYDGQKLIDDDECIKSFGMKDGDQLYFARHAHYKVKRRSRKLVSPRKHRMSSSSFEKCGAGDRSDEEEESSSCAAQEGLKREPQAKQALMECGKLGLAGWLKGFFSHSKLATAARAVAIGKGNRPRLARGFFCDVRKILWLSGRSRRYYQRTEI